MGDAGEGLVDAEARIQERMEELARERAESKLIQVHDPQVLRHVESLRLARVDLQHHVNATSHEGRRAVLAEALADLDRQLAEARAALEEVPA